MKKAKSEKSEWPLGIPPVVDKDTLGLLGSHKIEGISVVIVTYNSLGQIGACVESVMRELGPDDELIIIDNASVDSTPAFLTLEVARQNNVKVVLSSTNFGFSAGSNLGLKISRGRYLCLLNPDTRVTAGVFNRMKLALSDSSVGAVGPLSDNVGARQFFGKHLAPSELDGGAPEELITRLVGRNSGLFEETKLLIGFCLAIRRDLLNRLGLLDEAMFLGSEDLEISWRIRTNGLSLLILRDSFVHHASGRSFASLSESQRLVHIAESTKYLIQKLSLHYSGRIPTSLDLWGTNIVDELKP